MHLRKFKQTRCAPTRPLVEGLEDRYILAAGLLPGLLSPSVVPAVTRTITPPAMVATASVTEPPALAPAVIPLGEPLVAPPEQVLALPEAGFPALPIPAEMAKFRRYIGIEIALNHGLGIAAAIHRTLPGVGLRLRIAVGLSAAELAVTVPPRAARPGTEVTPVPAGDVPTPPPGEVPADPGSSATEQEPAGTHEPATGKSPSQSQVMGHERHEAKGHATGARAPTAAQPSPLLPPAAERQQNESPPRADVRLLFQEERRPAPTPARQVAGSTDAETGAPGQPTADGAREDLLAGAADATERVRVSAGCPVAEIQDQEKGISTGLAPPEPGRDPGGLSQPGDLLTSFSPFDLSTLEGSLRQLSDQLDLLGQEVSFLLANYPAARWLLLGVALAAAGELVRRRLRQVRTDRALTPGETPWFPNFADHWAPDE